MSSQKLQVLMKRVTCCDPFKIHEIAVSKGLRTVSHQIRNEHLSLQFSSSDQLCTSCRKRVSASPKECELSQSDQSDVDEECEVECHVTGATSGSSATQEDAFVSPGHELSVLNASLCILGESPIEKRKAANQKFYGAEKARKISVAVKRRIELGTGSTLADEPEHENPEYEIIEQLKEKFRSCTKRSDKIHVLTVLPKSWTRKQVMEQFGATEYMARKAKSLVKEKGILSTPNPRAGKTLPQITADRVQTFYHCDEISRVMPGKKDCVSVSIEGVRQNVQKRLVLCNLR
jgi:hypothetical protein